MLTDLTLVNAFYAQQRATAQKAKRDVVHTWNQADATIPLFDRWQLTLPTLTDIVTEAQYEAVNRSAVYAPQVIAVQGGEVKEAIKPVGFLSPTDYLDYGLTAAPVALLRAKEQGAPDHLADAYLKAVMARFAVTMVEDAGRESVQGLMLVEDSVKYYYRKLQTPSCGRCAILVGRPYKKSVHFKRHPQCDCTTVPAVERDSDSEIDLVEGIKSGDITGYTDEEIDAIVNDNADINQITNAKKGMQTADLYGKKVQVTTTGTTRRAVAGQRLSKIYGSERVPKSRYRVASSPRLTPTQIYRETENNPTERKRQMYRAGYIL